MSATPQPPTEKLTFRRYVDGDVKWESWREQIFQASWSHKCPTYIQSTPPCQGSCPSGEDIRGYLNIARGIEKPPAGVPWQEYAFRRLTEANPFPSVMGRVCPAPCETGCNRNEVEDHVGINSVEHFLGEYAIANDLKFVAPQTKTGRKVAVIGGGPAGLSCAYQLALKGHAVTIFDEHELLGGMMRYGIPGFRTPRAVLDAEIQRIVDLGVEVRLKCRIGTDVTLARDPQRVRRRVPRHGRAIGAATAGAGRRRAERRHRDVVPEGVQRRPAAPRRQARRRHRRRRHVDRRRDRRPPARPHRRTRSRPTSPSLRSPGHMAHDVASVSAKQGAEVTLTSVFDVDKMQANKHEIEQALAEGIAIRGGLAPVRVVKDANGRATALVVARCEAKFVGPRLEIKMIEGTEEEIPADLIVSAIGQAVDFTGLEEFDIGKGAVATDKNYQIPGKPGTFAGGDVIRPHLLTTAIGHGAIAAEGIDRHLRGEDQEKRPKVDVHAFDLKRKMIEKGLAFSETHEPILGTDRSNAAIHNYENRSDRYVIPHEALFLGHFTFVPRNRRHVITLSRESALGNFEERLEALSEADAVAEAKRCMSCGQCFECDNCVVYCPQTAVARVPKKEATTGRYVYTDYDKCIGCHICADVCPTGYIQMGLGE